MLASTRFFHSMPSLTCDLMIYDLEYPPTTPFCKICGPFTLSWNCWSWTLLISHGLYGCTSCCKISTPHAPPGAAKSLRRFPWILEYIVMSWELPHMQIYMALWQTRELSNVAVSYCASFSFFKLDSSVCAEPTPVDQVWRSVCHIMRHVSPLGSAFYGSRWDCVQ